MINPEQTIYNYIGDGVNNEWDFDCSYEDKSHLKIAVKIGDGSETVIPSTDYTVVENSSVTKKGGKILYPTTTDRLDSTAHVAVYRVTPLKNSYDFKSQEKVSAPNIEYSDDEKVMQIQELSEQVSRAVKVERTDTSTNPDELIAELLDATAEAIASGVQAKASEVASEANKEASAASVISAQTYAQQAAQSAAEGLYGNVVGKTFADSPLSPIGTEEGTLFKIDTSAGNVVVNLLALSVYAEDMKFAFVKVTSDTNTVTINAGGTDTIDSTTYKVLSTQFETHALIGDSATGTWLDVIQGTGIADGDVTEAKLANGAVTTNKINSNVITGQPAATLATDDTLVFSDTNDSGNLKKTDVTGVANVVVGASRQYTGAHKAGETALTSTSASIAIDLALNNDFTHTFTENTTLANPSNIVAGQSGAIRFTQHASSPKTLAFGSYWDFAGGTAPTVTATNSARDTLFYHVRDATHIEASMVKNWS